LDSIQNILNTMLWDSRSCSNPMENANIVILAGSWPDYVQGASTNPLTMTCHLSVTPYQYAPFVYVPHCWPIWNLSTLIFKLLFGRPFRMRSTYANPGRGAVGLGVH
jgi:hypothetical protein